MSAEPAMSKPFTDSSRDQNITPFGQKTLEDRYLLEGETYQDCFWRVANAFAEDVAHAKRMYDYISQMWFMPATPVLSNGGTDRGLPISCYLNEVDDSLEDIAATADECIWLGSAGGGIGTNWSKLRAIGEPVRGRGHSSGIIPFIRMMDSQILAISQGSLRRGAAAMYLHISHPEIEEFLQMRKPTGDHNRKALNLHHGIVIPDSFMKAVEDDTEWELVDPRSKQPKKRIKARHLFERLLEMRVETGEPYLLFEDTVNRAMCPYQKQLGLQVKQSNLCSEIMLHTGKDHLGNDRTAVCCLGSVNLEKWDEWKDDPIFVQDCLLFLDNVLQDFIEKTAGRRGFHKANYSAQRERSVGLGAMGFHSYLQSRMIPFESPMAKGINMAMFKHLRKMADKANIELAKLKGPNPDAKEAGAMARFSHMLAIAPTASISIICGGSSPCVEPWNTNFFIQKTLSGSIEVRNKYLARELEKLGKNTEAVWLSMLDHDSDDKSGSIQHLDLPQNVKDVFKTAFEIDQRYIIEFAGDRAQYIDQGQSINLFLLSTVDKWDLLMLHYTAWKRGVKSLYYCRSQSKQRASSGGVEADNKIEREVVLGTVQRRDYEECSSCQ